MNGIEYSISVKANYPIDRQHTFRTLTTCITNIKSRRSLAYRESSRGSSLARQKTQDSPKTDFSIILHRHTAVTQHGMVYSRKRLCARNKTNSSYKAKVSSRTSISSFISLSTVSNACSKCKQTVYINNMSIFSPSLSNACHAG